MPTLSWRLARKAERGITHSHALFVASGSRIAAIGMGQFNNKLWNTMSYKLTNSALISQAVIGYGNKIMTEWELGASKTQRGS